MISTALKATLAARGWLALDLLDPAPVCAVRDRWLAWLRERHPTLPSLGN
jgi:hypothetical protein